MSAEATQLNRPESRSRASFSPTKHYSIDCAIVLNVTTDSFNATVAPVMRTRTFISNNGQFEGVYPAMKIKHKFVFLITRSLLSASMPKL